MGHVFQTYAEAGDLGRHRTDQVTPPVSYTPEPNPYKTGELLTWRREGKYIYIYIMLVICQRGRTVSYRSQAKLEK